MWVRKNKISKTISNVSNQQPEDVLKQFIKCDHAREPIILPCDFINDVK